jgi:hypothetical protein
MSVASISVMPPARQWPLSAAITGFQISSPRFSSMPFCVCHSSPSGASRPIHDFRSAPALNTWSPAPVTMATRMASSSRTRVQASDSAW